MRGVHVNVIRGYNLVTQPNLGWHSVNCVSQFNRRTHRIYVSILISAPKQRTLCTRSCLFWTPRAIKDISLLWRSKSISAPINVVAEVNLTVAQQMRVSQCNDYRQTKKLLHVCRDMPGFPRSGHILKFSSGKFTGTNAESSSQSRFYTYPWPHCTTRLLDSFVAVLALPIQLPQRLF